MHNFCSKIKICFCAQTFRSRCKAKPNSNKENPPGTWSVLGPSRTLHRRQESVPSGCLWHRAVLARVTGTPLLSWQSVLSLWSEEPFQLHVAQDAPEGERLTDTRRTRVEACLSASENAGRKPVCAPALSFSQTCTECFHDMRPSVGSRRKEACWMPDTRDRQNCAQGGSQVLEAHGCQKPWTELPCQVAGKDPGTPCHLIT